MYCSTSNVLGRARSHRGRSHNVTSSTYRHKREVGMVIQAVWTDGPALRDITIGAALDEQASLRPDAMALILGDHRLTWGALAARVDSLSRGLIAWGVDRGDHVAVMGPNSLPWVLLEYALGKIGAVLVTVNPSFRAQELSYLLQQGQVSTLFVASRYRQVDISAVLQTILPDLAASDPMNGRNGDDLPDLRRVGCLGPDALAGALPFDRLLTLADQVSPDDLARRALAVQPDDVFQIQYTSGTTGKPKGAMLTHKGTYNNARLMADRAGFGPDERLLSAMPFFHTAGCVCNVLGMLAVGGCLIALPDFDAGDMLAAVEDHRATVINAVPTMYLRMLDHPDLPQRDVSSFRIAFAGGTSIPPAMMRDLKERMGADPMIIMGMTECSPIITQTDPADDFETRISTAGKPLPHIALRIIDPDTGAPVAFGEPGELLIQGFGVTRGYFDMPDQTAETIDADGWLRSGDLAVLAETGHLRIVGRIKDMLIRGGENIYPVEIEDALLQHPDIAQAQVIGVPDPQMGEEICAFVTPAGAARLDPEEVKDWCKATFARHKMPRHLHVIDAMPLTANGKVQKFELRRMAAQMLEIPT